MVKNIILFILLFNVCIPAFGNTGYDQFVKEDKDIYLNYYDLLELSKSPYPRGELDKKLNNQLNTVIIKQPQKENLTFLEGMTLGEFFRVVSWNIERGFNVDLIEKVFLAEKENRATWQDLTNDELIEELKILSKASIIILNEVDIGMPRTKYENIVQRLSDSLKMGYVFGTEFVEVDPYQLGLKKFSEVERTFLEKNALEQLDNIDKNKYLGLHGAAILTKYPILSTKIIRLPECYSWYKEESDKLSVLELARRESAEKIFSSKVLTELRHGSRVAVVADLLLPNKDTVTVVATHLENRCLPECRFKQFEFLLNRLRNIKNPLILAGDFNTTGTDASPVSFKKEVLKRVKDPEYLAKNAILSLTPISFAQNVILGAANKLRQFKDPTIRNIPIVLPNKERKLFDYLKDFRFNDRTCFDVRGVLEKTHRGNSDFLSNSNERDLKGYKPTFELERSLGVAKYKLDWFFVKPLDLKNPNDKEGSYAYAPHYGRTLGLVNRGFGGRISDHDPIVVDIPINEPSIVKY